MQSVEQGDIVFGKLLLGVERHNLPVGAVDSIDDIGGAVVAQFAGRLFGELRYLVHRHNLSAHINRLSQRYGAEKDIMYVVGHRVFGQIGYLRRDRLAVRPYDRLAGHRILDDIELIALSGEVEILYRQELVAVEDRQLTRIIHIAAVEVDSGQISGESLLVLIFGLTHLLGHYAHRLVVAQRHTPAILKREHILSRCAERDKRNQQNEAWHFAVDHSWEHIYLLKRNL